MNSCMMKSFLVSSFLVIICIESAFAMPEISFKSEVQQIYVHELFTFRVSPDLFNWTSSGTSLEQFRYRPSLLSRPSLPTWMNFQFSKERQLGYLYGSATENYSNRKIDIEIVGLNKQNYETRRIVIPVEIIQKAPPANRIEMKITNLNWVHLTDLGRVKNLKGIFTDDLWPESVEDLKIIFMESAIKLGARLPLKPQNREGVIVHLGSNQNISKRLEDLSEEIRPLSKLSTCTFKRTKEEKIFASAGFSVDWCTFKVITQSHGTETTNAPSNEESSMLSQNVWLGMARDEVPMRNYSEEIAIAVAIPTVLFAMFIAMLTIVICFHHEKFEQPTKPQNTEPLQMVQYSGTDSKSPKTTTLKSLHEPYTDNLSLDSPSPSSSFLPEGSPKMNPYYRPNPPAYNKGRTDGPSSSSTVRFMDDI